MKCEIIRDLLPSYVDGLTSEESNFGANAGGGAGEGGKGRAENQFVPEV